jgi:glycosyltransferase involved in cell wall biosynthesis
MDQMTSTRVSVIIPAFHMARFLQQAVASTRRQQPAVSEIIVLDSGATADTPNIVRELAADGAPIRLMQLNECPPGAARNAGLDYATGDIIAFLDVDDLWPPNKLARQLGYLQAHPEISAVSGFVTYFDELDPAALQPAAAARVETLFGVHVGAWLYRRQVFERVGRFDESFLYSEDVDLFMRIRENGMPFTILRDVTLYYRRHPHSMMSQNNPRKHSDFRMAVARSLARRRAENAVPADLGSLETFLER